MTNPTLEALSQLVTDAAKKAAEEAVAKNLADTMIMREEAMVALATVQETQAKLDAALALADTLNTASEQRIVATADVVLASLLDVVPASMSFEQAIRVSRWVTLPVVNRLGGPLDMLPPGHYGVVICLYRQGPRE